MDSVKNIVEELLPNDLMGKNLFHYTSADGLLGILNSQKLHSSHIFYLNDYEENLNIWKFFFAGMRDLESNELYSKNFINAIKSYFDHWNVFDKETISHELFREIKAFDYLLFVFSFSHNEDDLSQWRAYTNNTFGFCLKFNFDLNFLNSQTVFIDGPLSVNPSANSKILLRNCIYNSEEKKEIIAKLLGHAYQKFCSGISHWHNELFFDLLTLNIFFKNEKFESEKECRMAILPTEYSFVKNKQNESILDFRKGNSFLIPFIKLDLTPNIIKEIIVGPSPFPQHSLGSLKMLLMKLRKVLGPIDSKTSLIPYRYW